MEIFVSFRILFLTNYNKKSFRFVGDAEPYNVTIYVNLLTKNMLHKYCHIANPPVELRSPPFFTQGGLISAPLRIVGAIHESPVYEGSVAIFRQRMICYTLWVLCGSSGTPNPTT